MEGGCQRYVTSTTIHNTSIRQSSVLKGSFINFSSPVESKKSMNFSISPHTFKKEEKKIGKRFPIAFFKGFFFLGEGRSVRFYSYPFNPFSREGFKGGSRRITTRNRSGRVAFFFPQHKFSGNKCIYRESTCPSIHKLERRGILLSRLNR